MKNIKEIQEALEGSLFSNVKINHILSYPIINTMTGNNEIVFFTTFYTDEEIKSGYITRPVLWIVLDINTGNIKDTILCKNKDFCDANYSKKYLISGINDIKFNDLVLQKEFDEIRDGIIHGNGLDIIKYEKYFQTILSNTIDSYADFYICLNRKLS